jgi:hypothetical protein
MKFHLSERYVSYWYDATTPPVAVGRLPSHIANNHLIPSTEDVARELERVRIGNLVTLQGKLVDVERAWPGSGADADQHDLRRCGLRGLRDRLGRVGRG